MPRSAPGRFSCAFTACSIASFASELKSFAAGTCMEALLVRPAEHWAHPFVGNREHLVGVSNAARKWMYQPPGMVLRIGGQAGSCIRRNANVGVEELPVFVGGGFAGI